MVAKVTSKTLTHEQQLQIMLTERITSVFSVLGCLFVILTFIFSSRFRRPVNRLIFYATFGNLLYNIASFISLDGPFAGYDSALCQSQGFFIQAFLPADAMWNLSMAINVYLTVIRKYNVEQLRHMEKWYLLVNYGLNIVIAFAYIFVSTPEKGRVYGEALLWCWVDSEWDDLRIATCYGVAWVCIILSAIIYVYAGHHIYSKRNEIRRLGGQANRAPAQVSRQRSTAPEGNKFAGYITTEVSVSHEAAGGSPPSPQASKPKGISSLKSSKRSVEPYSVRIESVAGHYNTNNTNYQNTAVRAGASDANRAAWSYAFCAFVFFVSLLITWVPSSVFRVSLLVKDPFNWDLAYTSALVLPLVGFWNGVAYVVTSRKAVKSLFFKRESSARYIHSDVQMKRASPVPAPVTMTDRSSVSDSTVELTKTSAEV